jgi:hypothetical protein
MPGGRWRGESRSRHHIISLVTRLSGSVYLPALKAIGKSSHGPQPAGAPRAAHRLDIDEPLRIHIEDTRQEKREGHSPTGLLQRSYSGLESPSAIRS